MNHRSSAIAIAGALALSLAHCSSTYSDLCEKQKDCEGGNDKDVDACVEQARGLEEVAEAYGCSDAFDKQIDCVAAKSTCTEKNFDTNGCESESKALVACVGAASGRGK